MNQNQDVIDQCRAFADFLERNDELPKVDTPEFEAYYFFSDDAKEKVAAFARAGASDPKVEKVEKDYRNEYFYLRFTGSFQFRAITQREKVCTRREVGTELVMTKELPAGVEYEEVEVERQVYEWDCDPLLASNSDSGPKITILNEEMS